MKIKKYNEFLNENVSDAELIKHIIQKIQKTGNEIDINIINNRLNIKLNGSQAFNTNNNQQGVQSVITFLSGVNCGCEAMFYKNK